MHWSGGLFLLLAAFCLAPLRLEFALRHDTQWEGTIGLHFLWLHPEKRFSSEAQREKATQLQRHADAFTALPETAGAKDGGDVDDDNDVSQFHPQAAGHQRRWDAEEQKPRWRERLAERWQRTSFQAQWKAILTFGLQAVKIIARWLHLEQLSLRCRIGWTQPSWTAYSYGLFWTAVSFLPERWQQQSQFTYVPDFEQARQEIGLRGIIGCRVGHLILILLSLLWLVVAMAWEQRRKEQMAYES